MRPSQVQETLQRKHLEELDELRQQRDALQRRLEASEADVMQLQRELSVARKVQDAADTTFLSGELPQPWCFLYC